MRYLLLLFLALSTITTVTAAGALNPAVASPATTTVLTKTSLEAELGRKLTFKERLAVKAYNRANKRAQRLAARAATKDRPASSDGNGMAIAGFVCGVLSLFVAGVILGVLGIVFGVIGMKKSRDEGRPLKGLALAGMICGIVGVVGGLIAIAVVS